MKDKYGICGQEGDLPYTWRTCKKLQIFIISFKSVIETGSLTETLLKVTLYIIIK